MAQRYNQDTTDLTDPEQLLRNRISQSLTPTADTTTGDTGTVTPAPSTEPAPFLPGDQVEQPVYSSPGTPVAVDTSQPQAAPAPSWTDATESGPGQPTQGLDPYTAQFQTLYQTLLGRSASNADFTAQAQNPGGLAGVQSAILASPEYAARQPSQTPQSPANAPAQSADWFSPFASALSAVQSTDDPNYWRQVIGNDPKVQAGDQSAINYWIDRIRRGDGSMLVRSGQLQKFQDTAATGGRAAGVAQPSAQFGSLGVGVPQGIWNSDFLTQIRNLLMQRLQAAGQPVDPNAPQIAEPLAAARDQAARQTEQERAQLAERAYAQGNLNTDVVGRGIQQSNERNATALGTLRGNLVAREFDAKRNELKDLMQMALAAGDAESARLIQMQMAQLDALLRQEGYQVQREGIGANLAINAANQNANTLSF